MKNKRKRNSSLELLRIISMVLIILSHYGNHGGLTDLPLSFHHFLGLFLRTGGKVGVICFVLISCYFMCEQRFKTSSLLKIILETTFYAVLMTMASKYFGLNVGMGTLLRALLAVFYGGYWFVAAYVGLYLVQPLLKLCTDHMGHDSLKKTVLVLWCVMSFLPFIFGNPAFIMSNFAYFCFIYFAGCYLRRYPLSVNRFKLFMAGCVMYVAIPVICIAAEWGTVNVLKLAIPPSQTYMVYDLNSPLMFGAAVCLFAIFEKIPSFQNRYINFLGSVTFAAYLLHDNLFFKTYMWKKLFHTEAFYNKNAMLVLAHAFLCTVAIFLAACTLELIRKKLEKFIFSWQRLNSWCKKFDDWYFLNSQREGQDIW